MVGNSYFAHSENAAGKKEPVIDHLTEVARLAKRFAGVWGAGEESEATALMHDLGKYTNLFQQVLAGKQVMIDHATPGALALIQKYGNSGVAAAIAVQGHHEGLASGNPGELVGAARMLNATSVTGRTYSERDPHKLLNLFTTDGGVLPAQLQSKYLVGNRCAVANMLYVRMLFSALTDADYVATEAHFSGTHGGMRYRQGGIPLDPQGLLDKLFAYKMQLELNPLASQAVREMRQDLFAACIAAGSKPKGLFTLTAPTGSGKTLSTLAFALKHAMQHKLRRVIVVLPFLSLIEQTARIYRDVVGDQSDEYVLEDHSLVEHESDGHAKLLAENWDAPLIVTTTVKFFEGLFAKRSTDCRRLHNIANSVIVFDEAQTMPPQLAVPTLAAVAELCASYGCSVVFATATQPAFDSLLPQLKASGVVPWSPVEIVPEHLNLAKRAERVEIQWPKSSMDWREVADNMSNSQQSLAVVNTRRHAKALYDIVSQSHQNGVSFHLSTDMCPAHRLDTLKTVRDRLLDNQPCYLVSTQCIEAGVDLDFPAVWRAFGPLESVIQVSGRCNRNGRQHRGQLTVFLPVAEEERYPSTHYEQAAVVVKSMLSENLLGSIDDATIRVYYQRFFAVANIGKNPSPLQNAIQALSFPDVAANYRWIPEHTANVLVPYAARLSDFTRLCGEARAGRVNRAWLRQARAIAVGVRLRADNKRRNCLEPIRTHRREETGWHILLDDNLYCPSVGLKDLAATDEFYIV